MWCGFKKTEGSGLQQLASDNALIPLMFLRLPKPLRVLFSVIVLIVVLYILVTLFPIPYAIAFGTGAVTGWFLKP